MLVFVNLIMSNLLLVKSGRRILFWSVVSSFLLVAVVTYGASTISTNISTGGTLTVTGAASLNGASTFGDAATDVNLFTGTLQASTTALFTTGLIAYDPITASSTDGNLLINGYATTTASSGNIATEGNLTVEGSGTFGAVSSNVNLFTGTLQASTTALFTSGFTSYGLIQASSTSANLLINGYATTTASSGNIATEGTLIVERGISATLGIASTSPSEELGVVGDAHFGSAATTTLTLSSSNANTGGCIQLEGANGTMYKIYATTTGPLIATSGSCQ